MSFVTLRAVAAASGTVLLAGLLLAPLPVAADEPGDGLVQMQEFPAEQFADEAAELPEELVEALERDVDITPEEYLARSAAAQVAVEVVDSLKDAGIGIVGSRLEGTSLVVNVETEVDAATVESVGAVAAFGEPEPLWDPAGLELDFLANIYGGQGWIFQNSSGSQFQCSLGFGGVTVPAGAQQQLTAGHCTEDMVGAPRLFNQTAPGQTGTLGVTLGGKVASTSFLGDGLDIGRLDAAGHALMPAVAGWNGSTGAPLATTWAITGDVAAVDGAPLCKSGSRTGWTCGEVVDVDYLAEICVENCGNPTSDDVIRSVNSVVARICVRGGDSGGTALMGNRAVGITSWGTESSSCNSDYAGFFPMISPGGEESVASQYAGAWELKAAVSAPVITSISPAGGNNTSVSGTVPNAGVGYKVDVYIDGSTTAFATANVDAGTGAWSVDVASLPQGIHEFSAVARYATRSTSAPTAGFIRRGMTIDRIESSNRYTLAVEISKKAYPEGDAPVVYVTTGSGYADALSAGPAAALQGGVMLLTQSAAIPAEVSAEITRLSPDKIVVVGGTASVSASVYAQLATIQPNIVRIGGANRFEASRNIVADAFTAEQPSTAYIATGLNYPDALGASAAGGAFGYPVILVNGSSSTIDAPTMALLDDLGVTQVKIVGGTASVSGGIFTGIKAVYSNTTRIAGANRYEASAAIALDAFGSSSPTWAYIATGANFPDALAGGPLAAQSGSPLLVVRQDCVPREALSAFRTLGVNRVTLLGGTASLTSAVQSLTSCP